MEVKCKWCRSVMKIRRVDDPDDILNSPQAIIFTCDAAGCGRHDKVIFGTRQWTQVSDTEIIRHEDDSEAGLLLLTG